MSRAEMSVISVTPLHGFLGAVERKRPAVTEITMAPKKKSARLSRGKDGPEARRSAPASLVMAFPTASMCRSGRPIRFAARRTLCACVIASTEDKDSLWEVRVCWCGTKDHQEPTELAPPVSRLTMRVGEMVRSQFRSCVESGDRAIRAWREAGPGRRIPLCGVTTSDRSAWSTSPSRGVSRQHCGSLDFSPLACSSSTVNTLPVHPRWSSIRFPRLQRGYNVSGDVSTRAFRTSL
jgi:hypothetical protein